jgi:two-component system LytT family response regulator
MRRDFRTPLARARERLRSREALELSRRLSLLLASDLGKDAVPSHPPEPPRRLLVGTGAAQLILDIAEIEWIEADDYYAAIHVRGQRHLLRESLASLEERLEPSRFVRVHRSAIVNLAQVREIRARVAGDSIVVLRDGTELPLSRRRRDHVADAIRQFAG